MMAYKITNQARWTYSCGCIQDVCTLTSCTPLKRVMQVKNWVAIHQDCNIHNFDKQPQAKWLNS